MANTTQRTEPQSAPDTAPAAAAARTPLRIERQGDSSVPYVRRYPDVRGGTCEFCGVIDKNLPAEYQYKLCEHYRDIGQLRCTYCPQDKNPDDIVGHSNLTIYEHPDKAGVLVVCCNSYNCTRAHEERFKAQGR